MCLLGGGFLRETSSEGEMSGGKRVEGRKGRKRRGERKRPREIKVERRHNKRERNGAGRKDNEEMEEKEVSLLRGTEMGGKRDEDKWKGGK